MTHLPWNQLAPETTYYIQSIYNNPGRSGKKVGVFDKIEDNDGTRYAKFKYLSDLPGATMDTGLGTLETNSYSTFATRFALPTARNIEKRKAMQKAINGHFMTKKEEQEQEQEEEQEEEEEEQEEEQERRTGKRKRKEEQEKEQEEQERRKGKRKKNITSIGDYISEGWFGGTRKRKYKK